MQEEKKYYEAVEVTSGIVPERDPDFENESIMVDLYAGGYGRGYYDFKNNCWRNNHGDKMNATYWLKPISLADKLREVAGKAFDAGYNRCSTGGSGEELGLNVPDKTEYLNTITD